DKKVDEDAEEKKKKASADKKVDEDAEEKKKDK
ncbi:hypothetical protein L195_g042593, partial [Trifolium pratense]